MNEDRKQQYFGELAPRYNVLTGNATQDMFAKSLESIKLELSSSSVIHDNAAGPGTATEVLLQQASRLGVKPSIIATDYAQGMVTALETLKHCWPSSNIQTKLVNSDNLSCFEDNFFTHSINNFSLFTISNPIQALKETRRTLEPTGIAIVIVWKQFAVESILATAQDFIKGDGYSKEHAVPINGPQYFQEGVVAKQLIEAGFDEAAINTSVIEHILSPGEKWRWDGLYGFLTTSSIASSSTRGWTNEEVATWPEAVKQAMSAELQKHGGLRFEAWATVAVK